jgi:hypothetical protein
MSISALLYSTEPLFTISPHTHDIAQRFYFIKRLSRLGECITNEKIQKLTLHTHEINPHLFFNPLIKATLSAIKETHSIQPLCTLWTDYFARYKYVTDPLFNQEFTAALLHILKNQKDLLHTKNIPIPSALLEGDIDTNAIALYFYALKRLSKPFDMLQKAIAHSSDEFLNCFESIDCFFKTDIISCIAKIRSKKNLTPLFSLWHDIQRYRYINDIGYVKEFSALLLIIYKKGLLCKKNKEGRDEKKSSPELYEHIETCSLEELLESIDAELDELTTKMAAKSTEHWYTFLTHWAPLTRIQEIIKYYLISVVYS